VAERLLESANSPYPAAWSADDRVVFDETISSNLNIGVVATQGDRTARPLLNSQFSEFRPALSPDGRWLAYVSNENGPNEIYVRPFPDVNQGKWQVSTTGGTSPVWSPDGREIFYRGASSLMAVPVTTTPAFKAGTPQPLFSLATYVFPANGRKYDISPDGRRFLFLKGVDAVQAANAPAPPLVFVENWTEELKRRVPR
jgi:Tol biopolymer transport system component